VPLRAGQAKLRGRVFSAFDRATMRRLLFHGTARGGAHYRAHRGRHGLRVQTAALRDGQQGVLRRRHFARDACYSDGYARTLPSGQQQMLLVDVVVGLAWARGSSGDKMRPLLPGEQSKR